LSGPNERAPLAVVFGCAAPRLAADERRFFRDADPLGFILFERNCETPDQVRALVTALRDCVGRQDAPVLIDQEGGRVARLRSPHWRATPAAARFARLAETDPVEAAAAARINAQLIAMELAALGITVDCAPVLDVPQPGAHEVIGDRAHGVDPETVTRLGRAVAKGLLAGGVSPVIKHIPGHGRARADSHRELPVVEAPRAALSVDDFAPFRALSDMPWAMTAHVLYTALDAARPATTSPGIIEDVVRGEIGFGGVLVSDDLGMEALDGPVGQRAADALAAGCDVALHCGGDREEMVAVAACARPVTALTAERLLRAEAMRRAGIEQADEDVLVARLDVLLAEKGKPA
jgi:beta-N-acetylhexosaminidase